MRPLIRPRLSLAVGRFMATKKGARTGKSPSRRTRPPKRQSRPRFVGREASPVLDRYPPKEAPPAPRAALSTTSAPPPSTAGPSPQHAASATTPPIPGGQPLITLDRPFDVDEFSALLGETSIRVTVPREALADVLHRVLEFMGFGIYVYSISVRPAPNELLKAFLVELQRVDYSADKGAWVSFVDKGSTDSPFGPSGGRT